MKPNVRFSLDRLLARYEDFNTNKGALAKANAPLFMNITEYRIRIIPA